MNYFLYTLQWHITNKCNWRCKHCYHDSYTDSNELSLEEMKKVFHDFLHLAKQTLQERQQKPTILLTGGEPFIHPHFLELLEYISQYKDFVRITILTNGSLLSEENLLFIKEKAPAVEGIQISIEGEEKANDSIRGKGAFQKILDAVNLLDKFNFSRHLSATISKINKDDILSLIDLLLVYNVPLVIRRFVPIGQGEKNMNNSLLSPKEMEEFYQEVETINQKFQLLSNRPTYNNEAPIRISNCMHGIYHVDNSSPQKRCAVTHKGIIVVMPDGTVLPCRLFPKKIGNIRENSLIEIYNSENYNQYTGLTSKDPTCKKCPHFSDCQGGALCISDAVYGTPFKKDPQCWR